MMARRVKLPSWQFRNACCEVMERLGLADDWWSDVRAYYGVSRREALALGERAPGRRPDLPGSRTCVPVSGKTWEEIWNARPRTTPEAIESFWREVGSWCVFRQLVRHRGRGFPEIDKVLPRDGALLEYGCGIAPVTWWLTRRRRDFVPTIYDVPSEAYEFARYRLKRFRGKNTPWRTRFYDVAVVLEVLEHVHDPLAAIGNILATLKSGGHLFEDYYVHDGHGSPADLESAALARPEVYDLIRAHCDLVSGQSPDAPEGGGRRQWRRR